MDEAVAKVMQFINDDKCKDENAMAEFIVNMLGEMYHDIEIKRRLRGMDPQLVKL